ncbi:M20 family metallopeptidase [Leucobacter tardus]|uniref:M20/M25/M40 family metallo-hydrolase n=1 Tax=Leucobacter tardus TaxID=501483 RepID=A0A939TTR5_9MICO|nr:M20/M25/M40 family metallo-hydrolase [Leucobacter tardus]
MGVAHAAEAEALASLDLDRIIADTCDLIRAGGENPGDTEERSVAALRGIAERTGAAVTLQEVAPGRQNLRAAMGPEGAPTILFLGHSDVVPAGEGWSGAPFEPRVADDRIVGRGSTDMKGGLAAVIAAMAAVSRVVPGIRLELLCTVDEEDRATGVHAALPELDMPDAIACIVAEPTDLDVVVACRGASNLIVDLVGASAHAGRPEEGASAISAASRLVQLVDARHADARAADPDPLLGSASWNVGTITGGSGTSMVPRQCTVTVDRRTMPGEDPEAILAELLDDARADLAASGIAGAERITLTGRVDMAMPGFRTSPEAAVATSAAAAVQRFGAPGRTTGWTAACEGGFIAEHLGVPTIILGPGDVTTQAHQPDEYVPVAHLDIAAKAYVLTVLRLSEQAQVR